MHPGDSSASNTGSYRHFSFFPPASTNLTYRSILPRNSFKNVCFWLSMRLVKDLVLVETSFPFAASPKIAYIWSSCDFHVNVSIPDYFFSFSSLLWPCLGGPVCLCLCRVKSELLRWQLKLLTYSRLFLVMRIVFFDLSKFVSFRWGCWKGSRIA